MSADKRPTCAACLLPLAKGQRAKISGTEVFHKQCSTARSSAQVTLDRQRRKLDELVAEGARIRQERDLALQDASASRREIARLTALTSGLERQVSVAQQDIANLQTWTKDQRDIIDRQRQLIGKLREKKGIEVVIGAPAQKVDDDVN